MVAVLLDRISNLVSEIDGRLNDGSLLNAEVSAYAGRLNAAIRNVSRVYPYVRDTHTFDTVIVWLYFLRSSLKSRHLSSPNENSYTPPRIHTGECITLLVVLAS